MAGLVPAIHVLLCRTTRRGCPAQGRAWRGEDSALKKSRETRLSRRADRGLRALRLNRLLKNHLDGKGW